MAPPTRFDLPRSRELSRQVKARNGKCYRNALVALARVPGGRYVEGLAVSEDFGIIQPHGWIEMPDGVIVDPTPVYCQSAETVRRYLPMFRWTWAEAAALMDRTLPLQGHLSEHGSDRVEFRDATLRAWQHIAALHEEDEGVPLVAEGEELAFLRAALGRRWVPREACPAADR